MNLVFSIFVVTLSVILTKTFCILAKNTRLMDKPNERSLHHTPTVRGGGFIFIGLSLLSIPFLCNHSHTTFSELFILTVSIFLLATISFIDDLYQLSARLRFLVQCIVALLIALFIRPEQLNFIFFSFVNQYLISAFLFFAVIWAINHFNFMDGLDGFSASQAIFLLAAYVFFLSFHSAELYQDFCLILIFSLLGFLTFNFPPRQNIHGRCRKCFFGSNYLCNCSDRAAKIPNTNFILVFVEWFIPF